MTIFFCSHKLIVIKCFLKAYLLRLLGKSKFSTMYIFVYIFCNRFLVVTTLSTIYILCCVCIYVYVNKIIKFKIGIDFVQSCRHIYRMYIIEHVYFVYKFIYITVVCNHTIQRTHNITCYSYGNGYKLQHI